MQILYDKDICDEKIGNSRNNYDFAEKSTPFIREISRDSWFERARLIFHFDCSISDKRRIKRQLNVTDLFRCARSKIPDDDDDFIGKNNETSLAGALSAL